MKRDDAIRATRNGAIAACISATVTFMIVIIAIASDAEGKLLLWNSPLGLLDVILISACAYGMYKKSRVASVLIFVYFLVSKIIISIETNSYHGMIMGILFLYFYGKAIQGSFVYHKLEKEENPDYKPVAKWAYFLGIIPLFAFIAIIVMVLISTIGVIPSTRVQSGSEMLEKDITLLVENNIISNDDRIEYFYSEGLISILEGGNILTHDRVISYITNESDEIEVYEIHLDKVTDVELEVKGSALDDAVYKVVTDDPDAWIRVFLSLEQKGDQKFIKALRSKIGK